MLGKENKDWFSRTLSKGTKGLQRSYNDSSQFGQVTFEHIGVYPRRAEVGRAGVPGSVCFAPGGTEVTFLQAPEGGLTRSAFVSNIETGAVRELCKAPVGIGQEATFSLEEQLRRERQRQLHTGISSYSWSNTSDVLLVPIGDELFVQRGVSGTLCRLFDKTLLPSSTFVDPRLSRDGSFVCFVCDKEVYACKTHLAINGNSTAVPIQLTFGARNRSWSHGLANFIAQEEMNRFEGFWISPCGNSLAFEEVDENKVPKFRIMHLGKSGVGEDAQEDHNYPFAGGPNPIVRLGVVRVDDSFEAQDHQSISKSKVWWIDYSCAFLDKKEGEECYLARVEWINEEDTDTHMDKKCTRLVLQVQNRAQTKLQLLMVNIDFSTRANVEEHHESMDVDFSSGSTEFRCEQSTIRRSSHGVTIIPLIMEESNVWINLHNMFTHIRSNVPFWCHSTSRSHNTKDDFVYLWASERSGFMHLYLYNGSDCIKQITNGDWVVEDVCGVDLVKEIVYFVGNRESCLEKHLFAVPINIDNGPMTPRRITHEKGTHTVVVNIETGLFVDVWSSINFPFRADVCSLSDGSIIRQLYRSADPMLSELSLALKPPEMFTVMSQSFTNIGVSPSVASPSVNLYGCMYKPDPKIFGQGPYPLIVSTYGGPHVQWVQNTWSVTADLRAQFLSSQGYCVVRVDNRGSSRRGIAFEGAIKWNMGDVELIDQITAVKYLINQGIADPERIGIYGWSYGGYMSAMAVSKYPDIFKAAVAGAPVTSWDGYDTHYTERYMGTPESNSEGYKRSAVMSHCSKIKGSLLLVHGLIDENVHFRHTARLISALIDSQKHYELLLFPNERHQPRRMRDKIFMEKRVFNFFQRCL